MNQPLPAIQSMPHNLTIDKYWKRGSNCCLFLALLLLRFSLPSLLLLLSAVITSASASDALWYRCIVKASSHLGYYTFRINTHPCQIYWREIDTRIDISECDPPIVSGLKPSARDKYSVVWFNLDTGDFYDYLSGVKDRGHCTISRDEPEPFVPDK